MLDTKVIASVLAQLEEERGIPKEKVLEGIELALGTAYRKEYGKRGQVVTASFNMENGEVDFQQVKTVVDPEQVVMPKAGEEDEEIDDEPIVDPENPDAPPKERFDPERHIMLPDAKLLKRDAAPGETVAFPLERREDFGRIAAQTAKQVITQKIREAERATVLSEFGMREGAIVSGTVERVERGSVFLQMGRAVGYIPWAEQIPGERFRQGERVRAFLLKVEESPRGVFLRLSRAHPRFLLELFRAEVPEIASGQIEIAAVAREAGSRSKVAARSKDEHVDPVGALVGQRGVRVSTVTSELSGEKIDIIYWYADPAQFIEEALSPAKVVSVALDADAKTAVVTVADDQQSLAIGRGGQNVRLAAKLTGWRIDIRGLGSPAENEALEVKDGASDAPVAEADAESAATVGTEGGANEVPEKKEVAVSESVADSDGGSAPEADAESAAAEVAAASAEPVAAGEAPKADGTDEEEDGDE
ncbi:MAG TPA: transcription termination factor NusA [Candidatus Paceibacterota bacterium]